MEKAKKVDESGVQILMSKMHREKTLHPTTTSLLGLTLQIRIISIKRADFERRIGYSKN
ncbi:MAG: hypothetical protein J5821_00810 [Alphaproteobacteria bacterium]|nr:hypothetical protein [Alphaproteobacteria bacterium]